MLGVTRCKCIGQLTLHFLRESIQKKDKSMGKHLLGDRVTDFIQRITPFPGS